MTGDSLASWGGPADMSAWEAVMWRAEGDHRTRSAGVVVEILDTEPDWDRLVAAHDRWTQRIPRLRERVVAPSLPVVTPAWSPDPHFDLGYHLQHVRLPEGAALDDLYAIVSVLAARPLDGQRPPWEAMLVGGLPEGRAAYLFKGHHSLTDGLGMMQLLDATHGHGPETGEVYPMSTPAPKRTESPSGLLIRRLLSHTAAAPAGLARRAGRVAARLAADPVGTVTDAVRFGNSLHRMLTPAGASRSPILRDGGTAYRFTTVEVPLAGLKAAARAADGSVNDAFLAGLLGGMRRYHEMRGVRVDHLPMAIPVSLRTAEDPMGGNRFAAVQFAAPVGETDPRARMVAIHRFVADARTEPALGFVDLIAPLLSMLPGRALTGIAAQLTAANDLQASNLGGVGRTLYLAGAKVSRLYVVGPRPGVAAMVTMLSYEGTCCVGVNFDPDVITDASVFSRCLREGFDEVLDLAGERTRSRT